MISPAVLTKEAVNSAFFHHNEFSEASVIGLWTRIFCTSRMVSNIWNRDVIMKVIKSFSCNG